MTQDTQVLFAILLYLAFFAWIGWRRGFKSEVTVFVVAVGAWCGWSLTALSGVGV